MDTEFIAIQGFDGGVSVPIRVFDGEYALNGSNQYTAAPGWVRRLGDESGAVDAIALATLLAAVPGVWARRERGRERSAGASRC